jgi:hypothetical protein
MKHPYNFIDLSGVVIGRTTIESYIGFENDKTKWLARCSCGNTFPRNSHYVKRAIRKKTNMACEDCRTHNFIDLTGLVIGQLTVLGLHSRADKVNNIQTKWKVQCSCGHEYVKTMACLNKGKKTNKNLMCRSCANKNKKLAPTFDMTGYAIWSGIKTRCYNQKSPLFKRYGARGITVCERWRTSYKNFITDMGPRPSSKHSIDRINNNGNYEPKNCHWALSIEQSSNRSNTIFITYKEQTKSLTNWCREFNLKYYKIYSRYKRGERDPEKLLRR